MLRAERIQPPLRRASRVATGALVPATVGTALGFISAGRSEFVGTIGFGLVALSILVGGIAALIAFVLTIALFFSRTSGRP